MDWKTWIQDTSTFTEVQCQVEKDCGRFVQAYFAGDDHYGQEKFLKLYGDNLRNLENSLLRARDIHPSQYQDKIKMDDVNFRKEYPGKSDEVRTIMISEALRAARFSNTFLSSVQAHSAGQGQAMSQLLGVAREIVAEVVCGHAKGVHPERLARLTQAVMKLDIQARMKDSSQKPN